MDVVILARLRIQEISDARFFRTKFFFLSKFPSFRMNLASTTFKKEEKSNLKNRVWGRMGESPTFCYSTNH